MDITGICQICGKSGHMHTCRLCGTLTCAECIDQQTGICKKCKNGLR